MEDFIEQIPSRFWFDDVNAVNKIYVGNCMFGMTFASTVNALAFYKIFMPRVVDKTENIHPNHFDEFIAMKCKNNFSVPDNPSPLAGNCQYYGKHPLFSGLIDLKILKMIKIISSSQEPSISRFYSEYENNLSLI